MICDLAYGLIDIIVSLLSVVSGSLSCEVGGTLTGLADDLLGCGSGSKSC